MNFMVWEPPAKVSLPNFRHVTPTYIIDLRFHENFLRKMLTFTDPRKFSPSKVSCYMVL